MDVWIDLEYLRWLFMAVVMKFACWVVGILGSG